MNPCYKVFTRILVGDYINQKEQTRLSRGSSSSSSADTVWLFPKECNICKKYRVQYKGKRVFPIQIATNDAVCTIKAAAYAKDQDMYGEIKDVCLFAKEFKTHDHCYRDFTRGFTKKSRESVKNQDQDQIDEVSKGIIFFFRVTNETSYVLPLQTILSKLRYCKYTQ